MSLILVLARVLLAVVFVVAGLAKLADRPGSRQSLRDFGLPAALASPVSVLLPLMELVVGVGLLPRASAWWGAGGAFLLLLLFTVGVGTTLARGRTPDCHCFGQLTSSPIGWPTLLRNAVLAIMAGFILWQGRDDVGRSTVAWLGSLSTAERLWLVLGTMAVALLAVEAWVLVQLLGQNGRLLLRFESLQRQVTGEDTQLPSFASISGNRSVGGLPVGVAAPAFRLTGLDGESMTLDALLLASKPVVLVFTDPHCGPCTALLPDLGRWQRELAATAVLVLISRGTPEDNRAKANEYGLVQVWLQVDREVAETYQAVGTPSAVLVQADGTVGSPLAQGAEEIRALVLRLATGGAASAIIPVLPSAPVNGSRPCPHCGQQHGDGAAASVSAAPPGLPVGALAPTLRLPDLAGQVLDLHDLRGQSVLLLFWNPTCGYCQQMLPDLKAWESRPLPGAPHLFVISAGTVAENAAQGFHAPVLLDQGFTVGPMFGVSGTPSAVLIDADGRIAAPVAVGAVAVLALARADQPSRLSVSAPP